MTTPLVSICVPVYNVAPYIERCVRSIMEQTYDNLEYIFVDDSSTDNSIELLKQFIAQYPHRKNSIHIFTNDTNHGLAYTRRISIEKATGEYIACVDSDDYVELDMVQCLVDKALETKADIVVAGYYYETNTIDIIEPYPCDNETDYIYITLAGLIHHICSKLFRRTLFSIGRPCFAPYRMDYLEDRLLILSIGSKITRAATINKPLYHYVYRGNSVSQRKNEKHFQCLIQYWKEADKLLEELGLTEKYKQLVGTMKVEDKAFLLMYCDNRTRKKYVDLFSEEEKTYTPHLSRGIALMYWLTKHHLWLLTYLYQCYIRWLKHYK